MQRSLHFIFEIYYHSNMCHFLWKTWQVHIEPTLLHWNHLLPLRGDSIGRRMTGCLLHVSWSLMLEVPEASISLSSPSPHLFRLLPLYSADDLSSSRLMESSTHGQTHTHTHSYVSWRSANTLHMDSVLCTRELLSVFSFSSFTDWKPMPFTPGH